MSYFDRQGGEIAHEEWKKLFSDREYQRLAITEIGEYTVLTVWLGRNHSLPGDKPEIFETMVFPARSLAELAFMRYATEAEANAGHTLAVKATLLYGDIPPRERGALVLE